MNQKSESPSIVGEAGILRSAADTKSLNENDRGVSSAKEESARVPEAETGAAADVDDTRDTKNVSDVNENDEDEPESDSAKATTKAKKGSKAEASQQLVDHSYTDYAIVEEDDLRLLDENSSLLPKPSSAEEERVREKLRGMPCSYGPMKKNAGGVIQPFPGKVSYS